MRRTNTKRRGTFKREDMGTLSTGSQCGQTALDMEIVCHEVSSISACLHGTHDVDDSCMTAHLTCRADHVPSKHLGCVLIECQDM